eukprot:751856-Hanusia_phi.AAC.7
MNSGHPDDLPGSKSDLFDGRNSQAGGRASQKFQSPRASPADIDKVGDFDMLQPVLTARLHLFLQEAHEAAVVQELMGVEMFTICEFVSPAHGAKSSWHIPMHLHQRVEQEERLDAAWDGNDTA